MNKEFALLKKKSNKLGWKIEKVNVLYEFTKEGVRFKSNLRDVRKILKGINIRYNYIYGNKKDSTIK